VNYSEQLPFAPACERNKAPILDVLKLELPPRGNVLEIGSATGQHIVFFAENLPDLRWQPSDRSEYLPGLRLRLEVEGRNSIADPIELDVLQAWPQSRFNAVYSANTAHIMSWTAVCAMFEGVAHCLAAEGVFCLYGPFNEKNQYTAPSNAEFDRQLRSQDPEMGLRDIEDLESLARQHHMSFVKQYHLPANNQVLVFRSGPNIDSV